MSYVELAKQVAKEAGTMIKNRRESRFTIEEKGNAFDVVTELDKASESLIRKRILEAYPDHAFLGEEESFANHHTFVKSLAKADETPFLWIVDPIDGTSNYVQRIPGFTVSIALASKGEVIVGVVYDPSQDELFWAEKGKGAFVNGKELKVAGTEDVARSVIATGFPSTPLMREAVLKGIGELGPRCQTMRVLGSAALHLAYVAAGRLTAFWEYGLNAWDVAAGTLLITEAGGQVTDMAGNSYKVSTPHVVGSNGQIHRELLTRLHPIRLDV
ncbi:inositol monophosphatase [Brevibacillus borstelensis]|uniref:inositol monophosphatase family protein n=1 Tax=Brevibacillus borstelensis TaxID=45462 RepID=UPI0020417DC5|nr:inositol monophosphatase [Brevibacillus borstelensis]